jgi:hypothetical protein
MVVLASETSNEWVVVAFSGQPADLELPPLAKASRWKEKGQDGWQLMGVIPLSIRFARQDFETSLQRQGWRAEKTIQMGARHKESELLVFKKAQRTVLVMLTEEEIGETRLVVGESRNNPALGVGKKKRSESVTQ